MSQRFNPNAVNEITEAILDTLAQADRSEDRGEDAAWRIEDAFIQTRILLESLGLLDALNVLRRTETVARKNYAKTQHSDEIGEEYLVWGAHLWRYVRAVQVAYGESKTGSVTRDLIQILRATQYSITDPGCFTSPPAEEKDVHLRIEAVLRCVFPELLHKPSITKQIKQFEPDTGIPELRTLIEYKFVSSKNGAKKIADEMLADSRGYHSKEWDRLIFVIYETKRIKPEKQWDQFLRASGVSDTTSVIVINGEEPRAQKNKIASVTMLPRTTTPAT